MRRFLYIMLSFALYLLWGVSGGALAESEYRCVTGIHNTTSHESRTTDIVARNDSIQACATLPANSFSRSNVVPNTSYAKSHNSQHRYSSRQRAEVEKIMSAAIHSRHSGHTTHIFEYNHFRSSLRVVYYLHTLCRLRI